MLSIPIVQMQVSCPVIDESHAMMPGLFYSQDKYSLQREKGTKGSFLTSLENKSTSILSERIGWKQYYWKELYKEEV